MLNTIAHDADTIIELRINRPPVNAFNPELLQKLRAELVNYQENQTDTKAIILSGMPGIFSAGLDLPALLALDRAAMQAFWDDFFGVWRALALSPKPIVAAMTGHSPAGGTVLSLFCDYRVLASGDYKVGLNEVQVGLVAPVQVYRALQRLAGARAAERHLVAGDLIAPEAALRIGMVDELAEPEQVIARAVGWCRQHLALPEQAMLASRRIARAELAQIFASDDDGRAFLELWFAEHTQQVLRQVVANLQRRK